MQNKNSTTSVKIARVDLEQGIHFSAVCILEYSLEKSKKEIVWMLLAKIQMLIVVWTFLQVSKLLLTKYNEIIFAASIGSMP